MMKNIFLILTMCVIGWCKAQQVYPLDTSILDVPANSYFKDTKNELDPFVGTWEANFNHNKITLVIEKQVKIPNESFDKKIYRDQIVVRYEVKNKNGKVIESTLNHNFQDRKLMIVGYKFDDNNDVMAIYFGNSCGLGKGLVFLGKPSPNQISWSFDAQAVFLPEDQIKNCNTDVYLPETDNLIFKKK